jgi:hypothetical protein
MLRSNFARFCSTPRPIALRKISPITALTALPLILGQKRKDDADYLDACRSKRNTAEYDSAGVASEDDALELIKFVKELRQEVMAWLRKNHPELC